MPPANPALPSHLPRCIIAASQVLLQTRRGTGRKLQKTRESVIAEGHIAGSFPPEVPNALTVDVEDYFHVAALAPNIHRDTWNTRESRVVGNT